MTGTYRVRVACGNCGNRDFYDIPMGMQVTIYFHENPKICDNCGCKVN